MKTLLPRLLFLLIPALSWAHPHEWVDWSAGLVLDESKSAVKALVLEMTWDEWLSNLMLADFPQIRKGTLRATDLQMLDTTYGWAAPVRRFTLTVLVNGRAQPLPPPVISAPTAGTKLLTLVYTVPLPLTIAGSTEVRVSLYDPTYYVDMGISAKKGGFYQGVADAAKRQGSVAFEQDFDHPYYSDVYPEVVVFSLKSR